MDKLHCTGAACQWPLGFWFVTKMRQKLFVALYGCLLFSLMMSKLRSYWMDFVQTFKIPRNMSVGDELWPGWTVLEIIFKLLQIAVWCLWPVVLCAWYFYAMQKLEDNVCFVTPLIIIKIFATLQLWLLLIKFGTVYYTWNNKYNTSSKTGLHKSLLFYDGSKTLTLFRITISTFIGSC